MPGGWDLGELGVKTVGICDVPHQLRILVVVLKLHHHVASKHIQDFLEVFFMFFQYKMMYLVVSKEKNPLFV